MFISCSQNHNRALNYCMINRVQILTPYTWWSKETSLSHLLPDLVNSLFSSSSACYFLCQSRSPQPVSPWQHLWHPWANLLGTLLPTADSATLVAMCGSQLVQWPASRLTPPPALPLKTKSTAQHSTAQLLVQEWHRNRRVQQHVWLLMCATETVS